MESPRLGVTGAAGHLGRAVVAAAHRRGLRTVPLVRTPRDSTIPSIDLSLPGVEDAVAAQLRDVDVVLHLAAHVHRPVEDDDTRAAFVAVNADGTRRVIEGAKRARVRRIVYASTIGVYDFARGLANERDLPVPSTAYSASKFLGELELGAFEGERCAARLATVFGPGDGGNFDRLHRWLAHRPPVLLAYGDARKSIVHVDDAAEVLVALACAHAPPVLVNVAGPSVTVAEAIRALLPDRAPMPHLVRPPVGLVADRARLPPRWARLLRALESLSTSSEVDTALLRASLPRASLREPIASLRESYP